MSVDEWMKDRAEKDRSSEYRGVGWSEERNGWRVRANKGGKEISAGVYTNEVAAANVYNRIAKQLHKEKAVLNDVPFMSKSETGRYKRVKKKLSKYHGVSPNKDNRFRARTNCNGRGIHIGTFDTEIEAARAYNDYIIKNNLEKTLNSIPT